MATVIKKGSPADTVWRKFKEHKKQAGKEEIRKYCGAIKLREDPLKLQKQWRDEWK